LTGILAVAEAKAKAKQLMEKTGITSERIVLTYMFADVLLFVPKAKVSDKVFSLKIGESFITIMVDEKGKFTFHQKLEFAKLTSIAFELQNKIVKLVKVGNIQENLKKISDFLNKANPDTFRKSINVLENFTI